MIFGKPSLKKCPKICFLCFNISITKNGYFWLVQIWKTPFVWPWISYIVDYVSWLVIFSLWKLIAFCIFYRIVKFLSVRFSIMNCYQTSRCISYMDLTLNDWQMCVSCMDLPFPTVMFLMKKNLQNIHLHLRTKTTNESKNSRSGRKCVEHGGGRSSYF